jgi:hypothetical protein
MMWGSMLGESLSPQHGASSGCGWINGLQLWKVAANIFNKQLWTNDKGWFSSFGVGVGLTTFTIKNKFVMNIQKEPQTWTDSLDK